MWFSYYLERKERRIVLFHPIGSWVNMYWASHDDDKKSYSLDKRSCTLLLEMKKKELRTKMIKGVMCRDYDALIDFNIFI